MGTVGCLYDGDRSIRNRGGNVPIVIDTLVFDEGQITCPTNGLNPKWGGLCHSLSGNAGRTVVIIRADYISDDPTPKVGGGIALTLKAERRGCIITYQTVAGTLNPGGHPGSYNGQDAYNDMLVTDERSMHGQRTALPNYNETNSKQPGLYARCTGNNRMGGV